MAEYHMYPCESCEDHVPPYVHSFAVEATHIRIVIYMGETEDELIVTQALVGLDDSFLDDSTKMGLDMAIAGLNRFVMSQKSILAEALTISEYQRENPNGK